MRVTATLRGGRQLRNNAVCKTWSRSSCRTDIRRFKDPCVAAGPKTTAGPVAKASGKASTQKRHRAPRCSVRRLPRWRQFVVCLLFSWREAQENAVNHDGRTMVVPIERPVSSISTVEPTVTPRVECPRPFDSGEIAVGAERRRLTRCRTSSVRLLSVTPYSTGELGEAVSRTDRNC